MRRRRSAKSNRTPSQTEVDAPAGGAGVRDRKRTRGRHEVRRAAASAKKGNDCPRAKSEVPAMGPARFSAPASVPLSTPLARSSASDLTRPGTIACSDE